MILVENTLGNLSEPAWHDIAHRARVDVLALEHWEAPKSRLRKATEAGLELAISLPRTAHLHDGDVLHYDAAAGILVVARIPLKEVLEISLDDLGTLPPAEILRICFALGHGLGNQHWPAVIKGTTVYVPLAVDRKVMSSVMRTHAFEHVRTRFVPGEEVAPLLEAAELRMLFAGADATPHHHYGAHRHEEGGPAPARGTHDHGAHGHEHRQLDNEQEPGARNHEHSAHEHEPGAQSQGNCGFDHHRDHGAQGHDHGTPKHKHQPDVNEDGHGAQAHPHDHGAHSHGNGTHTHPHDHGTHSHQHEPGGPAHLPRPSGS